MDYFSCSWADPRTAPQPGSQLLLSGWESELALEEAGAGIWRRPLGSDSPAARHVHWQRHKTTSLPQKSRQPELLQLNTDREVNAACCWRGNATCHDWGEKARGGDELYRVPEIDPLLWRLGFVFFYLQSIERFFDNCFVPLFMSTSTPSFLACFVSPHPDLSQTHFPPC